MLRFYCVIPAVGRPNLGGPQALLHQLLQQILVHHRELTCQHAPIVHVRCEWLGGFVIS